MSPHFRKTALAAAFLLSATALAPAFAADADPAPAAAAPAAPVSSAPAPTAPVPNAPVSNASAPDTPAAPAASAPAAQPATPAATAGRVPAPLPGKGQVVFFRPSHFAGMAVSFTVHEGDKGVAKVGNNGYVVVAAEPGTHVFTTESEAKDSLTLEVEVGETYYVQQTLGMGILLYRPHLTPSDQTTFDRLTGLKLSTMKPTDIK